MSYTGFCQGKTWQNAYQERKKIGRDFPLQELKESIHPSKEQRLFDHLDHSRNLALSLVLLGFCFLRVLLPVTPVSWRDSPANVLQW